MSQAPGHDKASLAFLRKWEPAKRDDRPLTEGGKKFDLVSEYQPAGDQPQAIAELIRNRRRCPGSGPARCDRLRQNLHHGEGD